MSLKDCVKALMPPFGWAATLRDGSKVSEAGGSSWSEVKGKVTHLVLADDLGNVVVSLPLNQSEYIQGKTGSCDVNGGKVKVERRWIGFKTKRGDVIVASVSEDKGTVSIGVS